MTRRLSTVTMRDSAAALRSVTDANIDPERIEFDLRAGKILITTRKAKRVNGRDGRADDERET